MMISAAATAKRNYAAAETADGCFHCGEPLPSAGSFPVSFDGAPHSTCCRGCQAVAQVIIDNGLGAYYRNRSALPPPARRGAEVLAELELYDVPEVQQGFVRDADGAAHGKEAALLLDGITCGACIWLIEQRLSRLDGVLGASVNYATRRARVRWDPARTRLSAILRTIGELGYDAQPYDSARSDARLRRERSAMMWRLLVAGLGMMQVMMYAVPVYIADGAMTADVEQLMRLASLVLTTPVVLWSAAPFYTGAWRELKSGRLGMDVPVSIGIIAAFVASVVATLQGAGTVYYDSVSMFVFLLLGARFLEMGARAQAAQAQERLARAVPAMAERLERYPGDGMTRTVPAVSLAPGDHLVVRPGAVIPADGIVVEGSSAADEALLTGESRPVTKAPGGRVTGGSVNLQGPLTVRVERVGEETVLASIVRLMDRAQTEKPRIATAADRVARWFVAALLALTLVTGAVWYVIDPSRALWIVIAMLVVTCPCALSLATPAALTAATGTLYRFGVLATRGHALETLARATHIVFDKTGTLTRGTMNVVGVLQLGPDAGDDCLRFAAALEAQSEHPLGRAIVAAAGGDLPRVSERQHATGRGIEAVVGGRRMRIGTPAFVGALNRSAPPAELAFVSDEVTTVALGDEQGWLALITLDDELRADARRVTRELAAMGRTVCLLSGDHAPRVSHLARELDISVFRAGASPEDKLAFVRELQAQGAVVAMIGDGVNDAPVLAQAQVSIAIGGGTELARSSADMVLMSERLGPLREAVMVSARALAVIRQNLAWAAVYNAVALPLAMAGFVTPLVAAAGMSLSSLAVVLNALRLLRTPYDAGGPSATGVVPGPAAGK